MKKYKILLIALIVCFICTLTAGLTACTGTQGEQGEQGDNGLSAYELYLQNNPDYTGTETEWLALLYGENGKSAYQLYVETYGYTGSESQWIEDLVNGKLATVTYTVTFNSEGGSAVESQTVSRGGKITEPTTPTLAGHTFLGWYVGEEKWSFLGYSVTENVTLTAKWSVTNTDITYTLNNETETYEVTAYSGADEVIDILPTVDDIAVTAIVANAFKGNTSITTVIIPETVTSIGANAFDGCSNLTTVTLPASLTNLGNQAFANTAVKNVYYNGGLSDWLGITFGSGSSNPMFYGAALYFTDTESNYVLVESVTITGVTAINSCAFYGCTSLTSVTIGADITSIGDYAFKECTNLTTVDTQGTSVLATIGAETFYGCTSFTTITVPVSVTYFGKDAFAGCTAMTVVNYNGTADQWASISFINYSSTPFYVSFKAGLYLIDENNKYVMATDITINAAKINACAFAGCQSFLTVRIGSNVTSINNGAFYRCYNITEVFNNSSLELTIGSSEKGYVANSAVAIYTSTSTDSGTFITEGDYTFYAYTSNDITTYYLAAYMSSGTDLVLPTTISGQTVNYEIKRMLFGGKFFITSVIIPDCVTSIRYGAFASCSSLTNVIIGNGVTMIGERAFINCSALKELVIGSGVTTIDDYAFNGCTALTTVYYNGTSQSSITTISTTGNTALTDATWYYYSETQPTETGNYWHYVSGVPTIWTDEQTGE